MTKPITKKQYDIFYKSLDDEPGKDKKVKRIARESDTSLSHTYRCLKELKKHGNVLQTWKRPKQFIRVGRLPESNLMTKEQSNKIRLFQLKKEGARKLCEKNPYRWSRRKSMTKKMAQNLINKLEELPKSKYG